MLNFEIHSAELREIPYRNKAGEAASLFTQNAYVLLVGRDGKPEPYPTKIELSIDSRRGPPTPYPVGKYTLSAASFFVGEFGKLSLSPRLVPVKA